MAVAVASFFRAKEYILAGDVRLMHDTLKIALLVPGYVYDQDMVTLSDVEGLELPSSVHYTSGGATIGGKYVQTADNGKAELYVGAVEWAYLVGVVSHAVIYADVTFSGIDKPLLAQCSFGTELEFTSTLFRFTWPEPLVRW